MIQSSKQLKDSAGGFKSTLSGIILLTSIGLLILTTIVGCANIQRPSGGPKDSIPPKLLNESPLNYSRNFKEKTVTLTFDEFIKLNNQFKEFSISPDTENPVIYKVKKKNLVITLPDSLDESTTYTINFGKGLVDYNEGNPIVNYTYVFATGDELDSLSISGSVKNAFTNSFDEKKDENIKILLIPTAQDSIFGKRKANIFTIVDTAGNFKFSNLREDTYRIYALKEQNNDRVFNGNDEWLGFLNDSLHLDKDIEGVKLEISRGYQREHRTLDKKFENDGSVLLTFNKPLDDPKLRILFPAELDSSKVTVYSAVNDSVKVFLKEQALDSIRFELADKNVVKDTILIRTNKNAKYEREIKPTLSISNKVDRVTHIQLRASAPITSVDKAKITLKEDSVSRRNFQLQQDSLDSQLYHIRYNWRAKRNYELLIAEGAIRGPFDDTNKEFTNKFTLDEAPNYGNIEFKVTGLDTATQYIAELIDEQKEKIFDRQILPGTATKLEYKNFKGGKYSLRIIYDSNRNGRWDPADVYTGKQAEKIWYLEKTFSIRANWDQQDVLNVE